MKKISIIFITLFYTTLYGQFYQLSSDEGLLTGGLGVTWIDGQPHYSLNIAPEFEFANFGLGLNFRMELDSKGKIRYENFNTTSDYLSIIRYLRYGRKGDPFYARLGALDYATLGHGSIMYMYNNSPSYDNRKIGLEFDIDYNYFGIETVYGSFGEAGVAGIRGYLRPLQFTDLNNIPIISNLEIGFSAASDFNDKAGICCGAFSDSTKKLSVIKDYGNTNIIGFDVALPILKAKALNITLYYDYAKIIDFGHGSVVGAILKFKGLGLLDVWTKFERRLNGENYIPSYFNSMYEIERFKIKDGFVKSKIQQLSFNDGKSTDGYYGELLIKLLGSFDIIGSYQRLDDYPDSGILHLATDISPEGFSYVARAGYDKINIKDEKDLFTLDDRSYLFAELGYKPLPYLLVSMVYHWTFTPDRDANDEVVGYSPQKKIEPRISFVYPL